MEGSNDRGAVRAAALIDELVRQHRELSTAQARCAALMLDFAETRSVLDEARIAEREAAGVPAQYKPGEFAGTEIGMALKESKYSVQRTVGIARRLRKEAPDVWDAWQAGDITLDKAERINRTLIRLVRDNSKALLNAVVVDVAVCKTGELLGRWLNQFVARVEPDEQDERIGRSLADRYVSVRPDLDGVSFLSAALSSLDAAAIDRVLTAIAAVADPSDSRTLQQRRADALVDVLLGRISNGCNTRWDGDETIHDVNAQDRDDVERAHQIEGGHDGAADCEADKDGAVDHEADSDGTADHDAERAADHDSAADRDGTANHGADSDTAADHDAVSERAADHGADSDGAAGHDAESAVAADCATPTDVGGDDPLHGEVSCTRPVAEESVETVIGRRKPCAGDTGAAGDAERQGTIAAGPTHDPAESADIGTADADPDVIGNSNSAEHRADAAGTGDADAVPDVMGNSNSAEHRADVGETGAEEPDPDLISGRGSVRHHADNDDGAADLGATETEPGHGVIDDWDLPASAFRPDPPRRRGQGIGPARPGDPPGIGAIAGSAGGGHQCTCGANSPPRPAGVQIRPVQVNIGIIISAASLFGFTNTPGQLADRSALIPADTIRDLAAAPGTLFHRLVTDTSGNLLEVNELGRFASRKLTLAIGYRDGVCNPDTCQVSAARGDIDHVIPVPEGPTTAINLKARCRNHHRAKTHAGHTTTRTGPHTTIWTTPTGHSYTAHDDPLPVEEFPKDPP